MTGPPLTAARAGLIACETCGLLAQPADAVEPGYCPRCGARLKWRRHRSIQTTWALVIAAAICYIPADLLPVMDTCRHGWGSWATVRNRSGAATYRSQGVKKGGRWRSVVWEDKLVELAVKRVLEPIYEVRFEDSSYGYRPHRSQHQCLDELGRTIQQQRVSHVVEADIRNFFGKVGVSLRAFSDWARRARGRLTKGEMLRRAMQRVKGYLNYYAITDNVPWCTVYIDRATRILYKWLNRKSQRKAYTWAQLQQALAWVGWPRARLHKDLSPFRRAEAC